MENDNNENDNLNKEAKQIYSKQAYELTNKDVYL